MALAAALLSMYPQTSPAQGNRITFENAKEGEQAFSSKFWVCIFGSEKEAITSVRLDHVTSVSKHMYMVGSSLIREVTIDTMGNNSIRIYCMENGEQAQKTQERLSNTRRLLESKTGGISQRPQKKFPEGTYSHNIEYQVNDSSVLDKIYESLINAIVNNKGCTYKV